MGLFRASWGREEGRHPATPSLDFPIEAIVSRVQVSAQDDTFSPFLTMSAYLGFEMATQWWANEALLA